MKAKFNVVCGRAVFSYKSDDITLNKAIELIRNPEVISITITKQTPAQYLKSQKALNEVDGHE